MIVTDDFVVGLMSKYRIYVEIHSSEQPSDVSPLLMDKEPLHGVMVEIKPTKNGFRFSILDGEDLTKKERRDVIKSVRDQVTNGTIYLPPSVHFDSVTKEFILFK